MGEREDEGESAMPSIHAREKRDQEHKGDKRETKIVRRRESTKRMGFFFFELRRGKSSFYLGYKMHLKTKLDTIWQFRVTKLG